MTKSRDSFDAKLDEWLGGWPGPDRDDAGWEGFGQQIEKQLADVAVGEGEDVWFEAPLPTEPGEGSIEDAKLDAGGATMSEAESGKPTKKSLKDFAQRVSVAPPAPSESPPSATEAPKSEQTPLPASAPRASSPSLRASSPSRVSRPPEGRDSDSGMVDLNEVRKSATSIPDDDRVQPAQEGLLDDEPQPAVPASAGKKKGSLLPIAGGVVVAGLALAAGMVFFVRSSGAPQSSDMGAAEAPAAPRAAASMAESKAGGVDTPPAGKAEGLSAESLALAADEPEGERGAEAAPERPTRSLAKQDESAQGAAAPKSKPDAIDEGDEKSEKPKAAEDPDDLAGAMATAVGANGKKEKKGDGKSTGSSVDPGSIPNTPSQGAIQGAIGSVKGAAKACVADLDGPSRATVTFSSDGSVSSVSVSGAASGTPAAGCIQSALRRARVGPFKRNSFTVGVTIRP